MKIKFTLFLLFTFAFGFCQEKAAPLELINKTELSADTFIGYDKFDYLYFIKNNVLYKQKNGVSLEYKNLALGQITKVDLLNPLKVIVFYERFNTAVTLDNQLNETLKIDFSQIKTPIVVSKIGIAAQNQLWVFDLNSQQIFLYDTSKGTLKSVGLPISEVVLFYNSDFNWFEWLDENKNWYECSIFGTVRKLDYTFDFDEILFSDTEFIFYKKEEKIRMYNRNTKAINTLENSDKTFASLTYKNQILSIFTNQGISNYKITTP
jgi:hypothetical protein